MHISRPALENILTAAPGVVDRQTFQQAAAESERLGQPITEVLIGRGAITEEYLVELLEPYFGVPVVDLKTITIPAATLELVPEALAKARGVVAFSSDQSRHVVKVAMVDPLDYETIEFLRVKLNAWVEPYLVKPSSLRFGLAQYQRSMGQQFHDVIQQQVKTFLPSSGEANLSKLAAAVPIVSIVDSIIENAVVLNASDIHFEPLNQEVLVRYRIDGVLHEILSLNKIIAPTLVARVKVLANLQIDEHRTPQDGRFRVDLGSGQIDIRVSVLPVLHGEKIEMRLLKPANRPFTLEDLGLSPDQAAAIRQEIQKPHGMILATGPTGAGKTTTLYAILHILNTPTVNITTIEDPIEYEIARVNQTQVNPKAGITFATGLRSLLRQNPDILMVGEIRDNETVGISVHAALTGHLVLTTLHTNDAPSTFPRLLDMSAQPFLVSSTVNLVIAQRLVRKICRSCITTLPRTPEVERLLAAQLSMFGRPVAIRPPSQLFAGTGCSVCGHSGYQGQIGIFEVLPVSEAIRQLIIRRAPASEIRQRAMQDGMVTMFEDGLRKIERGVTTLDEVVRVVRE
ncbi:MAG: type II/IV secretion system protein [Candidatus Kerfeldbacteria bacterium]|nr:type II/IV secretion system protein [Candidatus Kerfeldbacteria bacterium]